jgi:hypothetical protein
VIAQPRSASLVSGRESRALRFVRIRSGPEMLEANMWMLRRTAYADVPGHLTGAGRVPFMPAAAAANRSDA